MRKTVYVCAVVLSIAVGSALADTGVPVDLPARARGAERIVVASIERVRPQYQKNEFGDELIVSHAELRVSEVLKGPATTSEAITIEVEGGTVDGITLSVSDLPAVAPGERAVFFLGRDRRGQTVPHLRGQGILKLDAMDRVAGTSTTLADVRRAVSGR